MFVEIVSEHPEYGLQRLLEKVPAPKPDHSSAAHRDCRLLVEHAISGLQNTAILRLGYPDGPDTICLIGEALGVVLDELFYISLRLQVFQD